MLNLRFTLPRAGLVVRPMAMKLLPPCCFVLLFLNGCGADGVCSSETTQIARDPASARYAVTSVRNCGATTGYATVVRVGRATEPQSAATEIFVADSDHGAATQGAGGGIWTSVVWTAPGRLSVAYASKARVFRQKSTAEGAAIRYSASDPLSKPPVD